MAKTCKDKKIVEKCDAPPVSPVVLVGTYRPVNAEWIKSKRLYNLPLVNGLAAADYDKFNSVVLYSEDAAPIVYSAKRSKVIDRDWLKANGYSVSATPHGEEYVLFELTEKQSAAKLLSNPNADVFVCSTRWSGKIDADFYKKPLPACGGKSIPNIFAKLKPYFSKWRSAYAGSFAQTDFFAFMDAAEEAKHVQRAKEIIADAKKKKQLTCVEICAGAGGQAIGLDRAGFAHVALVEFEREYCDVLERNKPGWNVICGDVHKFDGRPYQGVDLFAGGVPCPPFSVASKQLGKDDDRDLFPEAIRLISEIRPRAVMIENVRGLLDPKFDEYRNSILRHIEQLGYRTNIRLLHASDYGVPQIRPRVIIVGVRNDQKGIFDYPAALETAAPTVGQALGKLMGANGWKGLRAWVDRANKIAPTIVGGSKKHGGPDLGPTRARRAWAELGVDGMGIANDAPTADFVGMPRLTKEMTAAIQGFPSDWNFGTKKTAACRMIGNAFPPPVAEAVGIQIRRCLNNEK